MCTTCGCSDPSSATVTSLQNHDDHAHEHDHEHEHRGQVHPHGDHPDGGSGADDRRTVAIERRILAKNEALAAANREWLSEHDIRAVNLMSSPGAGKTTLLQRTIADLGAGHAIAVIEGDQETMLDAERIRSTGVPVVQINTGSGCHLDADMLRRGLDALQPADGSLVFVENVGNLVCPALFDLGEAAKVVVISVTEGDDKPLKYPHMFAAADLVIINKLDLLPHVDFDVETCTLNARKLNPDVGVLVLSAKSGDGMHRWVSWLAGSSRLRREPADR